MFATDGRRACRVPWIRLSRMYKLIFQVGFCLFIVILTSLPVYSQETSEDGGDCASWALVWADEFENEGRPNPEKWSYDAGGDGGGNDELQYYTDDRPANARVQNGRLIIEARNERWKGKNYTSARLTTKGKAAWTYGRFEVRARLPSGRGTWPAIWMLPSQEKYDGEHWLNNGEIDIVEHVGHSPDQIHTTVHTMAYNALDGTQRTSEIHVPNARLEFNVYAIEWTPTEIRGYVNDRHHFTFENERRSDPTAGYEEWPFDQPFHLILNLAVGGTWGGQKGVDPYIWPQRLEVDYVRVYERRKDDS